MAAHEQVLSTIKDRTLPQLTELKLQTVTGAPETIQHIVTGCKIQAWTAYPERHNQVAGIVYWNICVAYGREEEQQGPKFPVRLLSSRPTSSCGSTNQT